MRFHWSTQGQLIVPAGERGRGLLLAGRVHVDHRKVLRDLLHVLVVEQGVEARLVWKGGRKSRQGLAKRRRVRRRLRSLTVEADVVIGEDDGSVALGNAPHRHMENAVRSLDVMLLQQQMGGGGQSLEMNCTLKNKKTIAFLTDSRAQQNGGPFFRHKSTKVAYFARPSRRDG